MPRYLLAAEADQIQQVVFRAAHLREVVGGSQLLTRFCQDAPVALLKHFSGKALVSDGGSFRIALQASSSEQAQKFGDALAEVYRLSLDSGLTVAEPVLQTDDADFERANKAANAKLRRAKRAHSYAITAPQFPFMAFCATCGVGIAVEHAKRHADDSTERGDFLCASCRQKTLERTRKSYANFLEPFYANVGETIERLAQPDIDPGLRQFAGTLQTIPFAELQIPKRIFPEDADAVAGFDPRRYVAYLIADVNGMGKVFDQCQTQEQLQALSETLPKIIRVALAQPTAEMMRWTWAKKPRFSPMLPLILGGDDLFALMPAPWAIAVALKFCQTFAIQIKLAFEQNDDLRAMLGLPDFVLPSISAAVVICKSNYPFTLAYHAGKERLEDAKRVTKAAYHNTSPQVARTSALAYELILSSQLVPGFESKPYSATLQPFWTNDPPAGWGIPGERLLMERFNLHTLPAKRRAEWRALYDADALADITHALGDWETRHDQFLARIAHINGKQLGDAVKQADANLASPNGWHTMDRTVDKQSWFGSALPDLFDLWDFTYQLDRSLETYTQEDAV